MPLTYADKIIEVARRYIHVREVGGKNAGQDVERFQASVGARRGDAWCAAFVFYVCNAAAASLQGETTCRKSGAVSSQWKQALRSNRTIDAANVQPGDVWCRVSDLKDLAVVRSGLGRAPCHTGIVASVDQKSGTFGTIEGNTNAAGSREGDGVYEKTQRFDDKRTIGFWRPALVGA